MKTRDARCTNCGAHLNVEPQKTMVNCEYCQSTIMVSNAIELALVEIDHSKEIKKYRENLSQAVKQNNVEEIKRISQNIRDLIPNDFEALYSYAYSLSVEGKMSLIREFYHRPPAAPQEKINEVIEHISRYSDFRDKKVITTFIKQIAPEKLEMYEKKYAQRLQVEEQYAQVPRDVFICFSQIDVEVAFKVVETLENDGYTCWISSRNLRPNDSENYWNNIEKAIQKSQLFLVISSQSSMISKDVQREIEIAQEKNKRMFEYKIDPSPHTLFFKHAFNGIKWVDGIVDPIETISVLREQINRELVVKKNTKFKNIKFRDLLQGNKKSLYKIVMGIIGFLFIYISVTTFLNASRTHILFLTNGGPVEDSWTNEALWRGIEAYSSEYRVNVDYFEPVEITTNEYMKAIDNANNQGVEVVIGSGVVIEEIFGFAQIEYPEIQFIIIDGIPRTGPSLINESVEDNTVAITFDTTHSGFLAGYAAVMDGQKSLGYMGGFPIKEHIDFGIGFIAGTHYAAYQLGVEIEFPDNRYTYLNVYNLENEVYYLAENWFKNGTDLITLYSWGDLDALIMASEQNNGHVIATENDVTFRSKNILTSVFFNFENIIYEVLDDHFNGTLKSGETVTYGLLENGSIINFQTSNFDVYDEYLNFQMQWLLEERRFSVPTNYTELNQFTQLLGFDLDIRVNTIYNSID